MSKKSLFKRLIPGLVAVSFAGWGSMALADSPVSGDVFDDNACSGGQLIAGFNFPGVTGGPIVKLLSGAAPGAIEIDDDGDPPVPPYPWVLIDNGHDEITIDRIELLVSTNDGNELIIDQEFSDPPENGDLPKTDVDPALILQVYFCGKALLVEMSDATVELASGKATFSVDPVSEMKEKAASYKAVCVAESHPTVANGRVDYELNVFDNGIKCHIEEMGHNGKTFDHEAAVE
jgi:hypothetical protein